MVVFKIIALDLLVIRHCLVNCIAEPTPDMTERECFSNVLTARVLKSRWTETTRSVEQSV